MRVFDANRESRTAKSLTGNPGQQRAPPTGNPGHQRAPPTGNPGQQRASHSSQTDPARTRRAPSGAERALCTDEGMGNRNKDTHNRSKGTHNRSKGMHNRNKGTHNRTKGTDNRTKGTDNRSKGTDNHSKGADNRRKSTGNRGSGTAEGAEPLPRRLPRSRSRRGKGSAMHLHRDQARDVNGPSLTRATSEPGPGLSPATSASATGSAGLTPPHLRQIWGICIRIWRTRQRIMRRSDGDVRCGHLVGNATSRPTSALGSDRSHDAACA